MKLNKRLLWALVFIVILSLCWMNSSSISTVLLGIKGTITDGNLIKFSGTSGVGEDASISASDAADAVTKKHAQNTDTEAGGEWDFGAHSAGFTLQTATGDGETTIDWRLGNKFKFTFGSQNETFTFTAPTNPGHFTLWVIQDTTGSRSATWPTIYWAGGTAPILSISGNAIDIVSFAHDGTNYFGVASLAFATP